MKIRIATRKSPLALWQANFVKNQLLNNHPHLTVELIPMVTEGDVLLTSPLSTIGGKGLFVKQLELALLNDVADIAVHSMKDVPSVFPDGLNLSVICPRDDVRDAFVSNCFDSLATLPEGSIVGTSSLRRQCQLKAKFPKLIIKDLRGNVGTRLAKLDAKEYDAIILAAAGLHRLSLSNRIKQYIDVNIMLPAVGQGAIGIETRSNDTPILAMLQSLNDEATALSVTAERAMNNHLQGGCQVPIGCYSQLLNETLVLYGLVGSLDGKHIIKAKVEGNVKKVESLGILLAEKLLAKGAGLLLSHMPVTS